MVQEMSQKHRPMCLDLGLDQHPWVCVFVNVILNNKLNTSGLWRLPLHAKVLI